MASFHLRREQSHGVWDRDIAPVLEVDPGATVTLDVNDASGGQLSRASTSEALRGLDFGRINPVTGPVFVRGAEAGDALVVDILDVAPDSWGWTANIPGFGLLADEFPAPHLRLSRVTDRGVELLPGLRLPVCPFVGTIGVAMAEAGAHPVVPPGRQGGNMDIRHMTAGARLYLPVAVPGALFSLGDTHAAQGDGEVCGTAVEITAQVTVRLGLAKGRRLAFPAFESHPRAARPGRAVATTGIGPDLFEAARAATRGMIDEIMRRAGLDALDAYLLASTAADLKISEIVDQPNWVVSLHLETDILGGGA